MNLKNYSLSVNLTDTPTSITDDMVLASTVKMQGSIHLIDLKNEVEVLKN